MMMEEVLTSETSVNFYETARRNIPEDCHLHTRRRENLKSHKALQNMYFSPNIVSDIKSRRIKSATHRESMEKQEIIINVDCETSWIEIN
jgi:hypothetical protein